MIERRAKKWVEPKHELKSYMDIKQIDSLTIANATEISDKVISQLRTQRTTLSAERLFIIGKFYKDSIEYTINSVYPNLELPQKPHVNFEKEESSDLGKLFFPKNKGYISLKEIAYKTDISMDRLGDIMTKQSTIMRASELILIEKATNKKKGELFIYLFK